MLYDRKKVKESNVFISNRNVYTVFVSREDEACQKVDTNKTQAPGMFTLHILLR